MTVIEAGKTCPHCGKRLRADNKRGACSKCLRSGNRKGAVSPASKEAPRPPVAAVEVKGTAVSRFKIVAGALGFDGEGMLEEYAKTWLDGLRQAWLGALSKAEASTPAPVKQRAPAPVAVRLQAARDDRPAADAGGGA